MASKQATVDFILEQMAEAGDVSARKMFGEYGVYCGGKVVALVCDDQLFVKPTVAGQAFIGKVTEGLPYPGAKPWFLVTGGHWENGDWLSELIRVTARELPMPVRRRSVKEKVKKKAKAKPSPKPKGKARQRAAARQRKKPPRRA